MRRKPAPPIDEAAIIREVAEADLAHAAEQEARGILLHVNSPGGTVTGTVPGALVQASVPVDAVPAIAASAPVEQVQYPRRAGHAPVLTPARGEGGTGTGAARASLPAVNTPPEPPPKSAAWN